MNHLQAVEQAPRKSRLPRSEDANQAARTRNARLKRAMMSRLPRSDVDLKGGPVRLALSHDYRPISEKCYRRVFVIFTMVSWTWRWMISNLLRMMTRTPASVLLLGPSSSCHP